MVTLFLLIVLACAVSAVLVEIYPMTPEAAAAEWMRMFRALTAA